MSTDQIARFKRWLRRNVLYTGVAVGLSLAFSGLLFIVNAMPPTPPKDMGAPTASGAPPIGKGAAVFGANSPFTRLQERSEVVPWPVLTSVQMKVIDKKAVIGFDATQLRLHQKTQRIQGFMMPLEPGVKQSRFLLTSVPSTCAFCITGGPESMVEVKAKSPIAFTYEPVIVEGTFMVLPDDPMGMYYRLTDAVAVK
jgi:uncharacterized protein